MKSESIIRGEISEENVNFYIDNGYLIADTLFNELEIDEIRNETLHIFKGERGDVEGIIETDKNDEYFEILKHYNAVHFPHKLSEKILDYVKHKKVSDILIKIIGPDVKCMQSMLFVKGPGKPGQSWHQDEYYIPTRDCSLTGVWIAAEDATVENGCLWVIPGSHKPAYIRKLNPSKNSEFREEFESDLNPYSEQDAVPVEVKKGGVVFFNGYLFHCSLRNKTKDRFRTALVSHYMSARSMLPWNWDGRLNHKEDMRDILMISGTDHYDYKGIESLTYPYLRSEKKTMDDQLSEHNDN